jgi:flagellum-specific peptidoglycan hydrolase FlgJ
MSKYTFFKREATQTELDSLIVKLQQPEFFLKDTPSIQDVYDACKYYNIKYPRIVVSQAILETGYFKSEVCNNYKNLFGLYNSYKKDYYKFNHWTESVKAYGSLIQYKYKEGDYYQWIKNIGYAEDVNYVDKVKIIESKLTIFD